MVAELSQEDKERHAALNAKIKELDDQRPKPFPTARAIREDSPEPLPSYFLYRGSPDARGSVMGPGVLSVASKGEYDFPKPPETARTSWRRRGLADWIASA